MRCGAVLTFSLGPRSGRAIPTADPTNRGNAPSTPLRSSVKMSSVSPAARQSHVRDAEPPTRSSHCSTQQPIKEVQMSTATVADRASVARCPVQHERRRLDRGSVQGRPRLSGVLATADRFRRSSRSCSAWTSSSTSWSTGGSTSRLWINDIVPGNAAEAMYAVGVIEIVAGIAVAVKPRLEPMSPRPGSAGSSSTCSPSRATTTSRCGVRSAARRPTLARLASEYDPPLSGARA